MKKTKGDFFSKTPSLEELKKKYLGEVIVEKDKNGKVVIKDSTNKVIGKQG